MKRYFLLFSALSLAAISMAQTKISFGLRGGVTNAGIRGDAAENLQNLISYTNGAITTQRKTGVFGGGFVNIPVADQFSIEPGLYYSQKGYALNGSLNFKAADMIGAGATAQLTTNYIDLPVLVKADLNGLQLFAGPQVSYLADASLLVKAGALGFNFYNNKMDATGQFNRWDAGLTGGVGYRFNNGMSITAAYDHGLSRMNAGKSMEAYNQAVKVGVGFQF